MSLLTRIEGACHCKNIRFVLMWPGSEADISIRECGCTFCRMRTGSWTSDPGAKLVAEIGDESTISKYRFGTKTADFYVCSICGVVPFVTCEIDDSLYAVVNVCSFSYFDIKSLCRSATNFDGEKIGGRLDRRKRNWIPDVQIHTTAT